MSAHSERLTLSPQSTPLSNNSLHPSNYPCFFLKYQAASPDSLIQPQNNYQPHPQIPCSSGECPSQPSLDDSKSLEDRAQVITPNDLLLTFSEGVSPNSPPLSYGYKPSKVIALPSVQLKQIIQSNSENENPQNKYIHEELSSARDMLCEPSSSENIGDQALSKSLAANNNNNKNQQYISNTPHKYSSEQLGPLNPVLASRSLRQKPVAYSGKQQALRATVLLLSFLIHIMIISISTSLLVLYKDNSSTMLYTNLVLQGFFLGIASTSLNYEMIQITWQDKKQRSSVFQRMGVAYFIIIGINITITIELNIYRFNRGNHSAYIAIGIEIITLFAGFFIYLFYTALVKRFCFKKVKDSEKIAYHQGENMPSNTAANKIKNEDVQSQIHEDKTYKDVRSDQNGGRQPLAVSNEKASIPNEKTPNTNNKASTFSDSNPQLSHNNSQMEQKEQPNSSMQEGEPNPPQLLSPMEPNPEPLSVKKAIMAQSMIIFPFCQLLVSVLYAMAFKSFEAENRFWDVLLLCLTYPISIGILKVSMEKIAEKGKLKMKFYVEYLSIAFAALPFRALFLESDTLTSILALLVAKYFYKVSFYLVLGTNLERVKNYLEKKGQKLKTSKRKLTSTIFNRALKAAELEFEGDNDGIDVAQNFKSEPYMVEFAMKYILVMFSDIFSTISMVIIIKIFHIIGHESLIISDDTAERFVVGSMIDLGCDMLLVVVTAVVWSKSKSKIKKIDLISLAIGFFKRYYLVFVAANFNLFHTLFIVLIELSKSGR